MNHDEMIAVIKAHKEGKQIECKENAEDEWGITLYPRWDFVNYDYRVKPETEKKYWSKPEDVPMWVGKVRWFNSDCWHEVLSVQSFGMLLPNRTIVNWRDISNYQFWNGSEWVEPIIQE